MIYEEKMNDLREQVKVGDNIYVIASEIEGRYHYIQGPLDPTKLGNELWLHVNFGLKPTALETIAYASNVDIPFLSNRRISAIIKSKPDGTITKIE